MSNPDESSVVATVAWLFAIICGILVAIRSINKARIIRHLGADDVFIWAGYICFIGQCVVVQEQTTNGLGINVSEVTPTMRTAQMKAEYSNYLLYMPVIAFAKLSVVSVLRKCALNKKDRLLLYMFEWFLAAWVITSEFVRGFACAPPNPWDYLHGSCINKQAWVIYFELANILTELVLTVIPVLSISRMPTTRKKKLIAISFFSARILIVPASLGRIIYISKADNSSNPTYDLYPFVICTVMVAALEILAASVLYLRSLFEILETGFTMQPQTKPLRQTDRPQFGPFSKGTWPFTRMSAVDEHLTKRGAKYEARVQAMVYDVEKGPITTIDHIHVSRQIDIRTSVYGPVHAPSLHSSASQWAESVDKALPSPQSIRSGTFLLV